MALAACLLVSMLGCGTNQGPTRSPDEAAAAAMEAFDEDHDGILTRDEVAGRCGALFDSWKRFDADEDDRLTSDEIAARIAYWRSCGTEIMLTSVRITLDGRPLAGAQIELTPVSFLGPGYKSCRGATSSEGTATLLSEDTPLPGAYLGLYRMEITKAVGNRQQLPAKFNAESTLGLEIADDLEGIGQHEFHLRTND